MTVNNDLANFEIQMAILSFIAFGKEILRFAYPLPCGSELLEDVFRNNKY